jgi:hypothetical protein
MPSSMIPERVCAALIRFKEYILAHRLLRGIKMSVEEAIEKYLQLVETEHFAKY